MLQLLKQMERDLRRKTWYTKETKGNVRTEIKYNDWNKKLIGCAH